MVNTVVLTSLRNSNFYTRKKIEQNQFYTSFKGFSATNNPSVNTTKPSHKTSFLEMFFNIFKNKEEPIIIEVPNKDIDPNQIKPPLSYEEFIKTEEGQRRANLTKEEIEQEVNSVFNDALEKLDINSEYSPRLIVNHIDKKGCGGSYSSENHTIQINSNAYVNGFYDLEEIIYHEMKHCKNNLLRAGLSSELKEKIIKEELIKEIYSKKNKMVLRDGNFLFINTTEKPILNKEAEKKLNIFAEKYLFNKNEEIKDYLRILGNDDKYKLFEDSEKEKKIKKEKLTKYRKNFPDLEKELEKIANSDKEMYKYNDLRLTYPKKFLSEYALSIAFRYSYFTNIEPIKAPPLKEEDKEIAIQSLKDEMESVNGNANLATFGYAMVGCSDEEFTQYKFSQEEYAARKTASNIQKQIIEEKLANNNLSDNEKDYLSQKLMYIKARENKDFIGLKLYQACNEYMEKPTKNLKKEIKMLEKEFRKYKDVK